jgi:hypothetical protein
VQNADDAGAGNVQIEFNTKDYTRPIPYSGDEATDGRNIDLNKVKVSKFINTSDSGSQNHPQVFKWVVSNDGDKLQQNDWDRLTNIGDCCPAVLVCR